MPNYKEVFENNLRWIEKKKSSDVNFFEKLAKDQHPEYLYIGCSDSRVTAEDLMGAEPGEVFIHRNIANLVNATDLNVMSVINDAVRHLGVKHIVVCGHYNCGGVKAAMQPKDMGILNVFISLVKNITIIKKIFTAILKMTMTSRKYI